MPAAHQREKKAISPIHWGLGIRTSTVTETPLCDSLNVQILSVQYRYRDPLLYGYRDCLGIGTTVGTILLPRPPFVRISRLVRIPRPQSIYYHGLHLQILCCSIKILSTFMYKPYTQLFYWRQLKFVPNFCTLSSKQCAKMYLYLG